MANRTTAATARAALPQDKLQRRNRRSHSATQYAMDIGNVVSSVLCDLITDRGAKLKRVVSSALEREGFAGLRVAVIDGEVHVFIGTKRKKKKNRNRGHVIVPIHAASGRYHRGHNMPNGHWNHCA